MLPAGMIDLEPKQLALRKHIFNIAEKCFTLRGAKQIETPAIELLSTVTNLYGEEFDKLVYTLDQDTDDETKQKLIMRYDLTVPLARYIGSNGLKSLKRFQIGKVYRRDTPQIQKGRYREFYQCDFDIVGNDDGSYVYDLEMLETLHDVLDQLISCKKIVIKFNHREIVNNILIYASIPVDKILTVCSTLDKLDKKTWSEISAELVDKKISNDCITILEDLMLELFDKTNDEKLKILTDKNILSESALNNMMAIMTFINLMSYDNFTLEPFLIRGMDYYTGIIYEALYIDSSIMPFTIAAGGRYDNMMEKFSHAGKIPSIGMSLGIERIAKILEQTFEMIEPPYDVYIASIGKNMAPYKIQIASELRKHNIISTMSHMNDQKMRHQMDVVFEKKIPVMVIIGTSELETHTVTIKNISTKTQSNVPYKLMVETIKLQLN